MSIKYRTSAGTSASDFTDLVVKVGDTLPIGTEVDYDGQTAPAGWQEVDDPNVYSTSETRIGTWIDGKPIYRIVVPFTISSGWQSFGSFSNIDKFINIRHSRIGSGNTYPYYASTDNYAYLYIPTSKSSIYIASNGETTAQGHLIVEYTKTTD